MTRIHVASLLIRVLPVHGSAVVGWLEGHPGVEVRFEDPSGRIIPVVEAATERSLADLLETIRGLPGVQSAALVYHEIIDAATADEMEEGR
jgi:periplasmic nitrate reductase NapD